MCNPLLIELNDLKENRIRRKRVREDRVFPMESTSPKCRGASCSSIRGGRRLGLGNHPRKNVSILNSENASRFHLPNIKIQAITCGHDTGSTGTPKN